MSRIKGKLQPHTHFILDCFAQGLKPWQIALWDKRWTTSYVSSVVSNRRLTGDPRTSLETHRKRQEYSLETFLSHHYRYIEGTEYQCLRCKRRGEKEEIDKIQCTGDASEYKRGRKKMTPEQRLAHGRKYYKNG